MTEREDSVGEIVVTEWHGSVAGPGTPQPGAPPGPG